jgi:alkylhydroperoxidase family enzyme
VADATPLESELVALAHKSCEQPALLTPADLDPLRRIAGDEAIDYVLVIGAFHFINRIADLLDVDPDTLPERLRGFEPLRRFVVWVAGRMMTRFDLENRPYAKSYEQAAREISAIVARGAGRDPGDDFAPVRSRPKVLEVIALALEERARSTVEPRVLKRIHAVVEASLPRTLDDSRDLHERPSDPVEAFAFVGTRYASRTTGEMIQRLREAGYDDCGILDLAVAVADANQWARMHRLLGLRADLFSLAGRRVATATIA